MSKLPAIFYAVDIYVYAGGESKTAPLVKLVSPETFGKNIRLLS